MQTSLGVSCWHACVQFFLRSCLLAYKRACVHVFVPAYSLVCVHAFLRSKVLACKRAYVLSCLGKGMLACRRVFVHASLRASVLACRRVCWHALLSAGLYACLRGGLLEYTLAYVQKFLRPGVLACINANVLRARVLRAIVHACRRVCVQSCFV